MGRIRAIFTDTGHWLARCNHDTRVIELNKRDFPNLSPLMKDYIWVHEYVHLLYSVYDEAQCNAITDQIFVSRGKTERERRARLDFIEKSKGSASVSGYLSGGFEGESAGDNAVGFGISQFVNIAINFINDLKYNEDAFSRNEKSGFNGLTLDKQKEVIYSFLRQSFRLARRSSSRSAYNFFMGKMQPLMTPLSISSYSLLLERYPWILDEIQYYEKEYGVDFMAVTPADYSDVLWLVVIVVAILVAGVYLFKKYKLKK